MTEEDLINAGFKRQDSRNAESDNGYDYYYYILDLCEGVCLVSVDSDEVENDNWYIKSFEIPALKIQTVDHLKEFLELVRILTGCEDV